MNRDYHKKRYIASFVLPGLIFFAAIVLCPLFITAYYSLFEYNGANIMNFIGMDHYIKIAADDGHFRSALANMLILAGASVFIQLPLSFFFAQLLARGVPGEKTFRTIYFIPVVISSMVIGRLFISVFNSRYGLLNELIRMLGVPDFEFSWMTDPRTAFLTTVIPAVWQYIGYHMLLMYTGIKSIPKEYYEAAQIDGASGRKATVKITLPLIAPVLKICTIFAIVGSIKAFDLVYIMTKGGPNHVSEVPATLMYDNLFKRGLYGYGSAQAFAIVVMCIIISVIVNRVFKNAEENASM